MNKFWVGFACSALICDLADKNWNWVIAWSALLIFHIFIWIYDKGMDHGRQS